MPVIKCLDDVLANMIAAGEVVDRPASVVKELVENAIDAKATKIEVTLLDSGVKMIEITDNGIGMDSDDAMMAFRRHATSKLKTKQDLFRINTLGFRGEAIPSIASVSEMTIITSQGGLGYKVKYRGGKLQENGIHPSNKGTTVRVEKLFSNTPARLKYLKSLSVELMAVTEIMDKLILSNPKISFKFSNNNRVIVQTNGMNDMISLIGNVYGKETARNVVKNKASQNGVKLELFLVQPFINKSKRSFVTLCVNGRYVKNNALVSAVIEGYETYLPIGRYPVAVVNIEIDPMLIDVNVHPSKLEIRFSSEMELRDFIKETVSNSFGNSKEIIPEIKETVSYKAPDIFTINEYQYNEAMNQTNLIVEEEIIPVETTETIPQEETIVLPPKERLPYLEYIGQFFGTYLLCQNQEGLYIIDQHAAAERIRYEYFYESLGNVSNESRGLLIPITMDLTKDMLIFVLDNINSINELGFEIEEMGVNSICIRRIPLWINDDDIIETSEDIINYLLEKCSINISKIRDDLAKTIACKGSIKANKALNIQEVSKLLEGLGKCQNPFTCPHGRPTIIKFTNYEIEKMFKRVM